jgi:hypothetical protein
MYESSFEISVLTRATRRNISEGVILHIDYNFNVDASIMKRGVACAMESIQYTQCPFPEQNKYLKTWAVDLILRIFN